MTDFWQVAFIAGVIGFVIAFIYIKRTPSEFEQNLADSVYAGKVVIISVDDKAHIFKLEDGRMVIKQTKIKLDNNG